MIFEDVSAWHSDVRNRVSDIPELPDLCSNAVLPLVGCLLVHHAAGTVKTDHHDSGKCKCK